MSETAQKTAPPQEPSQEEINAFSTAASNGDQAAVLTYLAKHKPGLNNSKHSLALMMAACHGHADIVTLLLDKGADVNIQSGRDKRTALMWAAHSSQPEIVGLLLNRSADVNIQNKLGETALMMAGSMGRTDILSMLLEKGADINHNNGAGTALMNAALNGNTSAVALLLEKGADPDAKSIPGYTALTSAQLGHHDGTAELILQWKQTQEQTLKKQAQKLLDRAAAIATEAQIQSLKKLRPAKPSLKNMKG